MEKDNLNQRMKALWLRLRFKYKLSFFNENALEEVWSIRLSQMTVIGMLAVFAFILIVVTSMIIILTPIRNYLPGYMDVEMRKEIVNNVVRADSLERMLSVQSVYLENIVGILSGNTPLDSIRRIDTAAFSNPNYEIPRGKKEADFVATYEEEERFNLTSLNPNPSASDGIFFYKPVRGVVSAAFNADIRHYGIDLVTAPKESVLATLAGMVIFTGYDPNFGNVIQIQHKNGFLSVYKHNALLLKETGDIVTAGEAIALVGNTGKLSTGPHLHFELWFKAQPVDPAEYIAL
ncbi:Murein hydrolase activator NlpD precursor [Bacteroidales bacterium Barb6XT]|nr:Murein hydrolase activator NlpD precursor [Bacteroidales bacterium Barb6XT]